MYPSIHAARFPDKPAIIMANTGQVITYRELNERSIQVSRLLRSAGLKVGDHVAMFLENHPWFHIITFGAHRAGLYFTPISSRLTASEVDYIAADCMATAFITSMAKADVAAELVPLMPAVRNRYMLDGVLAGYQSFEEAVLAQSTEPLADETAGVEMLYSSGTTGRPKGILKPLPGTDVTVPNMMMAMLPSRYGFDENSIYLSPAPLYHAAPLGYTRTLLCCGGTIVVMEKFDAEQALQLIEKYRVTCSQWVPTMFVRMLKLPEEDRKKYDLSSHRCAIHAAAPCPVAVKEQMMEWWGPIIYEYYGGSEGNGSTAIEPLEWLQHKGSVGRTAGGAIHICDDEGNELPAGESGTVYFAGMGGPLFQYHNDPKKTAESRHPIHTDWSTLGDVGYLDQEGYLYLTDRKAFMIISGGVNIYPQETENLLVMHPKVADCAVFGVPKEEFGEEVKAVVQLMDKNDASPELAQALIQFCRDNISHIKCPRSIDFIDELPRHPTGKLYKRLLRDRYWGNRDSKIV